MIFLQTAAASHRPTNKISSIAQTVGVIYNVFEENLRLAKWSSAGVQRTPLQVLTVFLKLMPVGEDIILPSFYKIKSISISAGHPE